MKQLDETFISRNAKIIGALVAVVILIILGGGFILKSNKDKKEEALIIERDILDQTSKIEVLTVSIENQNLLVEQKRKNHIIIGEIESYSRQMRLREERILLAKNVIAQTSDEITQAQAQWEQYIIAYRNQARAKAIGEKHLEITTQSGKKFQNVTIKKIDDLRISISHDKGFSSIIWTELPAEMIDRLLFTKELADALTKSEQSGSQLSTSSSLKEAIANVEMKIKQAEAVLQTKRSAVLSSRSTIDRAKQNIQRLQGMIELEQKTEDIKQTPLYRSQIADSENSIQKESIGISEFVNVEIKYQVVINDLQNQLTALKQQLENSEKTIPKSPWFVARVFSAAC